MDDFELYVVDVAGRSEPVRVTSTPGFDGLPAFSPDGRTLVWTSNRGSADKTSQLYIGDWDDELARRKLGLQGVASPTHAPLLPLAAESSPAITTAELQHHVSALSSDVTEGRLSGTPGEKIATSYVARSFRSIGLEPAGDNGTYFQEFGFTAGVSLGEGNRLSISSQGTTDAAPIAVDRDWRPYAFSREGEIAAADVVFAGYGIVAPGGEGQRAIDSYAGLQVKDRWVLVFRFTPTGLSAESRRHLHRYSSLRYKAMMARDRGARGLLVVSGPNSKVREQLAPLRFDVSLAGSSIAVVAVTDALADRLLGGAGGGLAALQDSVDGNSGYRGFPLEGAQVSANIVLEHQRRKGRNVIGRLVVGEAPSEDFVLLGAHVDHLGRGEGASSLARADEKGMIHPGADDNASGVAAMLESAHALANRSQRGDLDARRDVVFAAWSGEEIGLLGSSHYVAELAPAHSGKSAADSAVAYLNMDMVGRMDESVSLFGVSSSSVWLGLIERENVQGELAIRVQQDAYLPTDATAFYMREIPILSAFTGAHTDYHTPRDRADRLDYEAMRDITKLMAGLTRAVAGREQRPDYIATKPPARGATTSGIRVYLGTIPDYAQSDAAGVVLSGVAKGGPAEAAGVRAGDMIVEVGGRAIENIYDYTYALDDLQIDEPTPFVVLRGTQRIELTVTPASRQ
jgi:hypothetical protein